MPWTDLSFPFGSILTSSKMTQLDDNFEALANGDSGAPAVQQAAMGGSAVGQNELKTTTGTSSVSNGSATHVLLPGGQYGFMAQGRVQDNSSSTTHGRVVYGPQGVYDESAVGWEERLVNSGGDTGYEARVYLSARSESTVTLRQRYVQASPPYDLGNGEVPLFVFLTLGRDGEVRAAWVAEDPPWANNGPTDIRPDHWRGGRPFKWVPRPVVTREDVLAGRASVRELREDRARADVLEEVEVTQVLKNLDMLRVPHPWVGHEAGTVVLLDPVSHLMEELRTLHRQGEDVTDLLHDGLVRVGQESLDAHAPAGVLPVRGSWK
ncbi:MAG TPA: hypothetical protein VKA48_03800 [Gammaproteobacteria bacterium]|nr:hypothetical protein [Gammaproteobacteria bacterium]